MGFLHYDTVVVGLISQVDTLLVKFVQDGYNAMAGAVQKPLVALGTLFIVLTGYGITQGFIKAPLQELYKFIIRMGFIYFFFMNWGNFSFYVVGLFDQGANQLGTAVMKTSGAPMVGKSVAQGLQAVFTDIFRIGWWTMKKASFRNFWPYYTAWFIWISGMIVVSVALFELVVAKVMLAICLATAPLFITLTLFDKTRAFFDRWLGSLVGFSLVVVFVSMVVGLCMSLITSSIAGYIPSQAAGMDSVGWAPIFLVSILSTACLFQAANIAKHIGGACHTAGGGAMIGGFLGGAVGSFMFLNQANKAWKELRGNKGESTGLGSGGLKEGIEAANNHLLTRGEL